MIILLNLFSQSIHLWSPWCDSFDPYVFIQGFIYRYAPRYIISIPIYLSIWIYTDIHFFFFEMGTFSHWFYKLIIYLFLSLLKFSETSFSSDSNLFFLLSTMLNKSKLCNEKSKPNLSLKMLQSQKYRLYSFRK